MDNEKNKIEKDKEDFLKFAQSNPFPALFLMAFQPNGKELYDKMMEAMKEGRFNPDFSNEEKWY